MIRFCSVSYTHLRAHETEADLVCRLLLETKNHLPDEVKVENIKLILKGGYEAAKDKKMHEILDTFQEKFTETNKD